MKVLEQLKLLHSVALLNQPRKPFALTVSENKKGDFRKVKSSAQFNKEFQLFAGIPIHFVEHQSDPVRIWFDSDSLSVYLKALSL